MTSPQQLPLDAVEAPQGRTAPATIRQESLMYFEAITGASHVYTAAVAVRLRGALDPSALASAARALLERHEALRTTVELRGGQALQVVHAVPEDVLELARWYPSGSEAAAEELARRVVQECERPLALNRGPLFRLVLFQVATNETLLLVIGHHAVTDGWSTSVILRDLFTLYLSELLHRPSLLPPVTMQYGDFASWEDREKQSAQANERLEHLVETLRGAECGEVPLDRPRPRFRAYRGARLSSRLSRDVVGALRHVARGTSIFSPLVAAVSVLIARYSGQDDVVIGSVFANRNRSETHATVGFLANTVVLRTHVKEDEPFAQLVQRVSGSLRKTFLNQDVPFESVVSRLRPVRDTSRQALFQVMFIQQNLPLAPPDVPGLMISLERVPCAVAKFDLTMAVAESPDGLAIECEYDTDLFDEGTVRILLGEYERLLEEGARAPERAVGLLRSTPQPIARHPDDHGASSEEQPSTERIHGLFEARTQLEPDRVAVVCQGQHFTYGHLNRRANGVAVQLLARGVRREECVGVCMDRSFECLAAVIGIMKAGAAVLPLDPKHPTQRLEELLRELGVRIVLTDNANRRSVATELALVLEALEAGAPVLPPVAASSLAYVICTSGSSGRPKATLLAHGGFVRLVHSSQRVIPIAKSDRAALFSSLCFDAALWNIFRPLSVGAALVVLNEDERESVTAMKNVFADQEINHAELPPSILELLEPCDFPSLSSLVTGGEKCSPTTIRKWARSHKLFNCYGPTEATVVCAVQQLGVECAERLHPPIGLGVGAANLWLLDERLKSVPTGALGELFVGGACLARGYHADPVETALRFIPHPYGASGERLYRTGDCARVNAAGLIEFVGRNDEQVKVRGHRIELGEIEGVLRSQPAIKDVKVVCHRSAGANSVLVGYYVSERGLSTLALRSALRQRLPEFMVPTQLVRVESLPKTPGGKVDVRKLAEAHASDAVDEPTFAPPETQEEWVIAQVWATLLGLDRVSRYDNFFERGGDSLRSLTAVDRLDKCHGMKIRPADLGTMTLAQLAMACRPTRDTESRPG